MKKFISILLFYLFVSNLTYSQSLVLGVPDYSKLGISPGELMRFVSGLEDVSEVVFYEPEALLIISRVKNKNNSSQFQEGTQKWEEYVLASLENYNKNLRVYRKKLSPRETSVLYQEAKEDKQK